MGCLPLFGGWSSIQSGSSDSKRFGGFHSHGGSPKWLLYSGKSYQKWMMTGGSPVTQETTISLLSLLVLRKVLPHGFQMLPKVSPLLGCRPKSDHRKSQASWKSRASCCWLIEQLLYGDSKLYPIPDLITHMLVWIHIDCTSSGSWRLYALQSAEAQRCSWVFLFRRSCNML